MSEILPLHLENIGFAAGGKPLISGVNLTIEAGERLLILGPNGAGKSLLLRLAHGLLACHTGRVTWAGATERAAAQAMVFQRPVMLRRSVRDNLTYVLSLGAAPRHTWAARVEDALERFGLTALAARGARLLSGGEQQRLALARAWLCAPQILFLDEPTAALDPHATRDIERIITELNAEGMTIVMTTHNLAQARRLASRVAFLDAGRLVETAPAATFFTTPSTAPAQAFLAGELLW